MRKKISQDDVIIDVHNHMGGISTTQVLSGSYPYSQDAKDLLRKMNDNQVDYAVVFPFITGAEDDFSVNLFNRLTIQEAERFGEGRLLPFLLIHLDDTVKKQVEEISILIRDHEIYGIKIYGQDAPYRIVDDAVCPYLADFFLTYDLPVLFHTSFWGNSAPSEIVLFSERYPDIRVTLAHAARFHPKTFSTIPSLENLYLDCSPLHMLCALMRHHARKHETFFQEDDYTEPYKILSGLFELFPDRLLYGSDSPFNYLTNFQDNELATFSRQFSYEADLELLRCLPVEAQLKIANVNIRRFLFGVDAYNV